MNIKSDGGKRERNDFWHYSDKVMEFIDTKTFTYVSAGLLLAGVILGVIAKYL